MIQCRLPLLSLLTLIAPQLCNSAFGDSEIPPQSYKQVAPGRRFVFVMLAPSSVEEEIAIFSEANAAEIREIRQQYARSGLYSNDGSRKLVWEVDWYSRNVLVASDGVHLIRVGPLTTCIEEEAVSFFANGKRLRTYGIDELVDRPSKLPGTVCITWLSHSRVDDEKLTFALSTQDGNHFVFDVRSGNIITESRAVERHFRSLWTTWAGLGLLCIVGGLIYGLIAWSRRKRRRLHPEYTTARTTTQITRRLDG
jgi:hypothetical protein